MSTAGDPDAPFYAWLRREIERAHREHALAEYADRRHSEPDEAKLYVDLYAERNGVRLSLTRPGPNDDRLTTVDCQRCADLARRVP